MATKTFKSRIQNKHDTEANWRVAANFKPLAGELIIYDEDNAHSTPRFKVGDGSTSVSDLPFVNGTMKFDADGFSYEDYGGNIGTFSPTNIILSDLIYKAAYDTTSISYKNISTDVGYDLNFPTKSGTFAVTTDIDVTAAGDNTFTGTNTFKTETSSGALYRTLINQDGVSVGGGPGNIAIDATYGLDNIKRLYGGTTYTYGFPSKNGTFAMLEDIPNVNVFAVTSGNNNFSGSNTFAGSNTFTGVNIFEKNITCRTTSGNSLTRTLISDTGFSVGSGTGSSILTDTVYGQTNITRKIPGGNDYTVSLPSKAGTIALTGDIPIKSATLDGTTLSITLA
mgnify:CR=1 FL=1